MNKKEMKKFLEENEKGTAKYVVIHFRAKGKGRRPSLPYKGEKNPQKALDLAMSELREIDPYEYFGYDIFKLIRMMIENANIIDEEVKMVFNGIPLYATADSTIESVRELQDKVYTEMREEYLKSSEYQEDLRKEEEEKERKIFESNELMKIFLELDFNNIAELIEWLSVYQKVGWETKENWKEIVTALNKHNYDAGMCPAGNHFSENDKEIFALELVGFAIYWLEHSHCVRGDFPYFAIRWLNRFKA